MTPPELCVFFSHQVHEEPECENDLEKIWFLKGKAEFKGETPGRQKYWIENRHDCPCFRTIIDKSGPHLILDSVAQRQ